MDIAKTTLASTAGLVTGSIVGFGDAVVGIGLTPWYFRRTAEDFQKARKDAERTETREEPSYALFDRVHGYTQHTAGRILTLAAHTIMAPAVLERLANGEDLHPVLGAYVASNVLSAGFEITRGMVKTIQSLRNRHYEGI